MAMELLLAAIMEGMPLDVTPEGHVPLCPVTDEDAETHRGAPWPRSLANPPCLPDKDPQTPSQSTRGLGCSAISEASASNSAAL